MTTVEEINPEKLNRIDHLKTITTPLALRRLVLAAMVGSSVFAATGGSIESTRNALAFIQAYALAREALRRKSDAILLLVNTVTAFAIPFAIRTELLESFYATIELEMKIASNFGDDKAFKAFSWMKEQQPEHVFIIILILVQVPNAWRAFFQIKNRSKLDNSDESNSS